MTNCSRSGGYDANGNLLHKTNANGQTVDYFYDALNRLESKTSTQDTETSFNYIYDQGTNGIGRLSAEYRPNAAGTTFAYDSMGRVSATQWFDYAAGAWLHGVDVQYDLAGNIMQLTYPDFRVVQQSWDVAGHLASVTDMTGGMPGATYFGNASYLPSGALASAQFGNGVTESMTLNNRLQPCRTFANSSLLTQVNSGANLYDRQAFYGQTPETNCGSATNNNGNIYSILEMNTAGLPSQNFTYDSLNRLISAATINRTAGASYNHIYSYDSFGNMLKHDQLYAGLDYGIDAGTNRLTLNGDLITGDLRYDAAGNLVTAPNPLGGSRNSWFTAEGDIRCISDGANPCGLASYLYNGSGERVFSAPNNQFSRAYVYLNSQVMEDIVNDTGAISDYIYANGRKVAKVDNAKTLYHMHGARDASTPNLVCGVQARNNDMSAAIAGVTIQAGDQMMYDVRQTTTGSQLSSALGIVLADGSWAVGNDPGVDGKQAANYNAGDTNWHHSVTKMDNLVGRQMGYVVAGIQGQPYTGTGTWDVWIANAVVVRADGSVLPLFTGQTTSVSGYASGCAGNQQTFQSELTPLTDTGVNETAVNTSYFLDDHLGTTQMELSAGGWPVWQGWFTPFGQELGQASTPIGPQAADGTSMRFKFTGKERDTESGLDYFGARYYGSSMGRWMSPDAINVTEGRMLSPSSTLNKYAYGGNNPLKYVDPDGNDVTLFYEAPGGASAGHIMLLATDQKSGDVAAMSFGPTSAAGEVGPDRLGNTLIGTNSTSSFDFPMSADVLRQNFSALTIQTTPEEAQKVIAFINEVKTSTNPYLLMQKNCTTVCREAIQIIKKMTGNSAYTPGGLWRGAYNNYGHSFDNHDNYTSPLRGVDYGLRSAAYDPFAVMSGLTSPAGLPSGTVTTSQGPATPCGGPNNPPCSK